MARALDLQQDSIQRQLASILRKATESADLNFLIGSGCSHPAISVLGNVEQEVQQLRDEGQETEAGRRLASYMKELATSTETLLGTLDQAHETVLNSYSSFLTILSSILSKRKSNIAAKHACVFTTNYDLFFERAYEDFTGPLVLSDGFDRRPCLDSSAEFTAAEFFKSVRKRGTLYSYEVHVPSASLVKLHGSLSWRADGDRILFSVDQLGELAEGIQKLEESDLATDYFSFIEDLPLIMPIVEKHRDTLLNQIYYDLLRIYANELDKENVLLLACGLSFGDEHILRITRRALRNPTLRLVVFSHTEDGVEGYLGKFGEYENVDIVFSHDATIDFSRLVSLLENCLPRTRSLPEDTVEAHMGNHE